MYTVDRKFPVFFRSEHREQNTEYILYLLELRLKLSSSCLSREGTYFEAG